MGLLLAGGVAGLVAGSAMWERSLALQAQRSTVRMGRSGLAGPSVLVPSVAVLVGLLSTLVAQRFDSSLATGLVTALAFVGLVVAAVVAAYRANAAALLIAVIVVADLVVVCSVGVLLVRVGRSVLS